MKTTPEYLDALRARLDLPSDYALAKTLGITRQYLSRYRSGSTTFSDETAVKVAELLNIDPAAVLVDMHAERTRSTPAGAIWHALAQRIAAVLFLGIAAGFTGSPGTASAGQFDITKNHNTHSNKKRSKSNLDLRLLGLSHREDGDFLA